MLQGISLQWSCSSNMYATCYNQLPQSGCVAVHVENPLMNEHHGYGYKSAIALVKLLFTPPPPLTQSLSLLPLPSLLTCSVDVRSLPLSDALFTKSRLLWSDYLCDLFFFFYINTTSCDLRPVVGGWRERGRTHMHLHTLLDSLSHYLVWVTSVSCCRMCHHQCDNFCFARGWNICFFLCYVCLWRGFFAVSTVSSSFFCFDQDCNR